MIDAKQFKNVRMKEEQKQKPQLPEPILEPIYHPKPIVIK